MKTSLNPIDPTKHAVIIAFIPTGDSNFVGQLMVRNTKVFHEVLDYMDTIPEDLVNYITEEYIIPDKKIKKFLIKNNIIKNSAVISINESIFNEFLTTIKSIVTSNNMEVAIIVPTYEPKILLDICLN